MLTMIVRLLAFVAAIALTADALLPTRSEFVHVERHERREHSSTHHFRTRTRTNYLVHFSGGSIGSCDVGSSGYDTLKDGDDVTVGVTRVLRSCDHVTRDGSIVVRNIDRWLSLLFAALALAVGLGWVTPRVFDDDDDDPYRRRHRGWWRW
jgi:hypothetical protein